MNFGEFLAAGYEFWRIFGCNKVSYKRLPMLNFVTLKSGTTHENGFTGMRNPQEVCGIL
jgi:hypothetical protein